MQPRRRVVLRRRSTGVWLFAAMALGLAAWPAGAATPACGALAGATMRFVVPNSPGGGYDTDARLMQPFLERELRSTVVIENRPDAGGLVGAATIRDARPDGRTFGIINASGLLAAGLDSKVPDPATDFTVLARLLSNRTVVATGRDSGIGSLEGLLQVAAKRPVVIGVRDAGSASVFVVPVVMSLLGVRYELVTGYVGNSARALAAIRGEVDVLVQNQDSLERFIAAGELTPLLQVTAPSPVPDGGPGRDPMAGVPTLVGAQGVAQRLAPRTGRTREQALRQADALSALIDAGRLIVAPRGLSDADRQCLELAVGHVLSSGDFRAAVQRAGLTVEPATAETARAELRTAKAALTELAPIVRAGMRRARQ